PHQLAAAPPSTRLVDVALLTVLATPQGSSLPYQPPITLGDVLPAAFPHRLGLAVSVGYQEQAVGRRRRRGVSPRLAADAHPLGASSGSTQPDGLLDVATLRATVSAPLRQSQTLVVALPAAVRADGVQGQDGSGMPA